jgi:L-alanine-DL-glutamate epimerase-like enolase superfamily enzyme
MVLLQEYHPIFAAANGGKSPSGLWPECGHCANATWQSSAGTTMHCRTRADLDRLDGKYQAINIKLDKAGGLTVALALAEKAKRRGLRIMVGGVISTSLGIALALLVAQQAEIVDLDGPLRLALDRGAGLRYDGSTIHPPDPKLWGGPG